VKKLNVKAWPFVFVSSNLFKNVSEILSEKKSNAKIIALAKYGEFFADKNMSVLTLPVYSISVVNTLNGVTAGLISGANKKSELMFTAPDARVLVVDDIDTNLKVAEGLLQPYNMRIDLCKSGPEAIEAVKRNHYDLVFMDHMMPEMDGIEATALIRSMEGERFRNMPIIALTANAVIGMREMFMEKGFNDFLTKPIDITKLDEMLDKWIPKGKKAMNKTTGNGKRNSNNDSISQLPNIPGVDTAKGIALTGGTIAFYYEILALFNKDVENILPLLQTIPEMDALPALAIKIHALKSVSASLGAGVVSDKAAALEAACKSGDMTFIRENLNAFAGHLAELAKNIRVALLEAEAAHCEIPPHESTENSSSVFVRLLRELAVALKSHKFYDIDRILEQLEQQHPDAGTKAAVEQISDEVMMVEYDKAAEILDRLLSQIAKE